VILIAFLGLTFWDAGLLGDDDFHARQAATERLATKGPLAFPALAAARLLGDLEARKRAGRILDPFFLPLPVDAHALWLFYGPDEGEGRWLDPERGAGLFLNRASDEYHHELASRAARWGLLGPDEMPAIGEHGIPGHKEAWVNVMRHRAWGFRIPLPR